MPPASQTPQAPRLRVAFILAEKFTLTAFACFVDVLRLSADEGDRSRQILCKWDVLSATQKPIPSSCGISIFPNSTLSDSLDYHYIVVVGGLLDNEEELAPEYVAYLKKAAAKGVKLVGLCTGGFILHRAGLMNGYKCCVSWFHHKDFQNHFNGLEPISDQIFVVDKDRLTCSGGTSSAHLAAYIVERHLGISRAKKSLQIMIVGEARTGDKAQPGIPLGFESNDQIVRRCLLLMQQNMSTPLSVKKIADHVNVGRRQLERRFKNAIGVSPTTADKTIRINQAKRLLSHSSQSVASIALDVGFCNSSHFIKIFKEHTGSTPVSYRLSANQDKSTI